MKIKTNAKMLIFSLFISLALILPIILYALHMGGTLSNKNEDWGDFGSFIGGIYGSFFSSLSLIVVVAAALETYRSNKEQIAISRNDQHYNQFNLLVSNMRSGFPKFFKYGQNDVRNIGNHYRNFEVRLGISVIAAYDENLSLESNLRNNANQYYLEEYQLLFEREARLFKCIINIIATTSHDLSQAFKIIFENTFTEEERLSLESYTRAHHPDLNPILDRWESLSKIPEEAISNARTNLRLNGKDA
ncbi:hypothetical protein [Enterobacter cloacae complex sp. P31C]|uniref:hypothetical protein n=1 Tax=Enterobacter cloacae complex sp. P31C TaxID=2779560 RepID=UPI001865D9DB|nr:hypothetical protein [Enterobacter cloacae complex sp. P31C]MBE3286626.1 hypothetical protein [Enterobacter cloacae complex sp. P31C]